VKRRRCWWELNEVAKQYVEKGIKKWEVFGKPSWMLKLPKDFICFHFNKSVPMNERLHFAMMTALARPRGALEYIMLEIDRIILRKVPRLIK